MIRTEPIAAGRVTGLAILAAGRGLPGGVPRTATGPAKLRLRLIFPAYALISGP